MKACLITLCAFASYALAVPAPPATAPERTAKPKPAAEKPAPAAPAAPVCELRIRDNVYRNWSVLKVEPDGLKIEHTAGISKVMAEDLPPEIAKNYDFSKVPAHRKAAADASRVARETEAAAQKMAAEIAAAEEASKPVWTTVGPLRMRVAGMRPGIVKRRDRTDGGTHIIVEVENKSGAPIKGSGIIALSTKGLSEDTSEYEINLTDGGTARWRYETAFVIYKGSSMAVSLSIGGKEFPGLLEVRGSTATFE